MSELELSRFGKRFAGHTAARQLMDDLGAAMASEDDVMMLGGGNPAHIPEVLAMLSERLRQISLDPREMRRMLTDYASPAGEDSFRAALAGLLNRTYGWPVGPENISLTGGSQAGFFQLFNMLAGNFDNGETRRILLPLTPEYLGYADLGLADEFFISQKPTIELLGDDLFKYHIDFESLDVAEDIAAICVSRPTNPTGNVLTDDEVRKLASLARDHSIPLILDNAYGLPFPGIIFEDVAPFWDENVILCMSLSKIGLPAARTGIVIARPEVIDALTGLNSVMSLAVSSVAPVMLRPLIENGGLIELGQSVIRPFYQARAEQALAWLRAALQGCEYRIHKPEGAFFLWLWLPGLKVSCAELYERLKQQGVFVIPGDNFFPGLEEDWPHRRQCIRISYSQDESVVRRGIEIIGAVVRQLS